MQNLRRGHYEIAVDAPIAERVAAAFAGPRLPLPTLPTTPTTLTFECPCSISSIC
jgi:hypothetical protein